VQNLENKGSKFGTNILAESVGKDDTSTGGGDDEDYVCILLRQLFSGDDGGLVAVMQACLDESGTHDKARVTCVGGYLFEPKAASDFQNEWRQKLRPFAARGVTYFHAAECEEPDRQSPFINLNDAERLSLFGDLVALIGRTAKVGFVAEVEDSVFDEWMVGNPTVNQFVGSKYISCCLQCFRFIAAWSDKTDDEQKIHYFFERVGKPQKNGKGCHPFDEERAALMNAVAANSNLTQAFRYAGDTNFPKGEMHTLEAADLLAWSYAGLRKKRPTDYTLIARRLFLKDSGVRHLCTTVTPGALTAAALFNEEHGLRINTYAGKLRVFKV
jgi:hypothetical protein